jgi:hypothetical protein
VFTGNGGIEAASSAGHVENKIELPKMREIDPQSGDPLMEDPRTDARLTQALRGLAASSRRGASAEVGVGLALAFRRHHARRRMVRRVSLAAAVACMAIVAGLMLLRSPQKVPGNQQAHATDVRLTSEPAKAVAPAIVAAATVRPVAKHVRPKATTHTVASRRQFLALPGYDPAVPADELHVVRVQMPASALWQMGAPVSADSGPQRVMADFVVSQDGTPYAVRLVQ